MSTGRLRQVEGEQGEEVVVHLPAGERRFRILELVTLPQQLGVGGGKQS